MATASVLARAGYELLESLNLPGLDRRNYHGATVSLAAGPALVAATLAGALVAGQPASRPADRRVLSALLAAVGAAALAGGYDDAFGSPAARGLRGHLHALRSGRLTTGMGKVLAIGAGAGLASSRLGGGPYNVATGAGLIAGAANLGNLLDLRPGRTAKVALLTGVPLLANPGGWPAAGAVGAAAGLLPVELAERGMLGDAGANALGAALGVALAARAGAPARLLGLALTAALTLASERVSFSAVIDATPALRWLDRLGRIA